MALTQKELKALLTEEKDNFKKVKPADPMECTWLTPGTYSCKVVGIEKEIFGKGISESKGFELIICDVEEPNKGSKLALWHIGRDGTPNTVTFRQLIDSLDPKELEDDENFMDLLLRVIQDELPICITVAPQKEPAKDGKIYNQAELSKFDG